MEQVLLEMEYINEENTKDPWSSNINKLARSRLFLDLASLFIISSYLGWLNNRQQFL
jgi:hypothetical protein